MASQNPSLSAYAIKNLDHLGLVAAMCRELQIAQSIDAALPKTSSHHVSHGQALVAMILNGLGFHSRTLHLFPNFFADKPLERLIAPGLRPEHLNDDALGRCLDALFEAGVSELYQVLAQQVISKLSLSCQSLHLDITSFHVDGQYAFEDDEESQRIQLVKGYSRDHRPELNQAILELICENQAGIPVYMQALSGNTNDQKAFKEVAKAHLASLKAAQECRYLVGDAALYTAETVMTLHEQKRLFVSRVPAKLKEAKTLLSSLQREALSPLGNGYAGQWVDAQYGDVPQKWLLLTSEQARKRELHTLTKNLLKSTEASLKQFQRLCQNRFSCEADALAALAAFAKEQPYVEIVGAACVALPVYSGKGRPKKEQQPERYEYQLTGCAMSDLERVEQARLHSGTFILATNDCSGQLSMSDLLDIYKSQQSVERGFRFLKSPEFLTSSLFLKKPERIEALLMVMTCSLMVYAALEHRIRRELKAQNKTFPDMKKQPGQSPTARWVFLCFGGIHELRVAEAPPMVLGVNAHQRVILDCLGEAYQRVYS